MSVDWTQSMKQTFEYYVVDPYTWEDKVLLDSVLSSSIDRDVDKDTLCTANITVTEELDECYIRIYLIVIQNNERNKFALGTFLVQTPSFSFNGKHGSYSINAYSSLLELKDTMPPLGYAVSKNTNIMNLVYNLCIENSRAPVVPAICNTLLYNDFVANKDDTWLTFLIDFMSYAKYKFELDEIGRILFDPIQADSMLQPVWDFTDDNSSLLYPNISIERDLYGVPNVVEVIYSITNGVKNEYPYVARVVNDSIDSPISTVNRGREVVHRVTNPNFSGKMTEQQIDAYAKELLKKLSTLEFTASYTHGYCPVRIGDCVYLNYRKAGLNNIKAVVKTQKIECKTGCKVFETATYTKSLWEG